MSWNIRIEGGSEVWVYNVNPDTFERTFLARFAYANPKRSANHFVKFLTENFTPEQYAEGRAMGLAPIQILEQLGYVSYNAQKSRIQL